MKTQTVHQKVLSNYRTVKTMVKNSGMFSDSLWEVSYKKGFVQGSVNGYGEIKRLLTNATCHSGWVDVYKKPLYAGREHALKKINEILEKIIKNFDNDKLVKKEEINMLPY